MVASENDSLYIKTRCASVGYSMKLVIYHTTSCIRVAVHLCLFY